MDSNNCINSSYEIHNFSYTFLCSFNRPLDMIQLFLLKSQQNITLNGWNWISCGQKQITLLCTRLLYHKQRVGAIKKL